MDEGTGRRKAVNNVRDKFGVEYELKVLTGLRDEIMKSPDEWFNRGITLCGDLAQMVFDAIDKYIEMEQSQNGGRK